MYVWKMHWRVYADALRSARTRGREIELVRVDVLRSSWTRGRASEGGKGRELVRSDTFHVRADAPGLRRCSLRPRGRTDLAPR
jgi:hypothetical protein